MEHFVDDNEMVDNASYNWYTYEKRRIDVPLSGKEMRKLFYDAGYELVPGAGKGSHWKLKKGNITVTIPDHRELKKGTEHDLLKKLKQTK